jgi:hypothetical protein
MGCDATSCHNVFVLQTGCNAHYLRKKWLWCHKGQSNRFVMQNAVKDPITQLFIFKTDCITYVPV